VRELQRPAAFGADRLPEGPPPALDGAAAGACICCQAVPCSDLRLQAREVARAAELEVRIMPCRVVQIDHLAHDVVRLYLKLPEQQRLQFLAGSTSSSCWPTGGSAPSRSPARRTTMR